MSDGVTEIKPFSGTAVKLVSLHHPHFDLNAPLNYLLNNLPIFGIPQRPLGQPLQPHKQLAIMGQCHLDNLSHPVAELPAGQGLQEAQVDMYLVWMFGDP